MKPWVGGPVSIKLGMMHVGNPSTKTVEAGRSKVQDPSELHSKSKASLRCVISERKGKREGEGEHGGREGGIPACITG